MESVKTTSGTKNFLVKTWKRCRSLPISRSGRGGFIGLTKSKSWSSETTTTTTTRTTTTTTTTTTKVKKKKKKIMTPEGCFPVYVGPDKQRFAVKTKYVNHPLFMTLLEDAETEYGYNCKGPILLPCDVDLFYRVLAEMEANDVQMQVQPLGWTFAYGSCSPFNPGRRLGINGADLMGKGYGSYEALTPWRSIKMS